MKRIADFVKKIIQSHSRTWWVVLLIGCFVRLFYIGNIPGNTSVFADEAISAYDAFSLLHYGYDMNGYHMPVYLVSWGDGTSILQPWLMMPFIALFGLSSFSIRLPQAILGCLSIPAFYYIAKKIRSGEDSEQFGLFAMFVFAFMPWHVMMSRWALDCNMIVYFLVFAAAALIKATEDRRFLPVAALLYAACLYSYALPWIVMPVIVLCPVIWLMHKKLIRADGYLIAAGLILFVSAVPLFIFILVNSGKFEEIRTAFFSVPRIPYYRSGELSLNPKQMMINFCHSLSLFVAQEDGRVSDATPLFGLFYKFSGIPILIGIAASLHDPVKKKGCYPLEVLMWAQFIAGILLGSIMDDIVFSRLNIILVPLTWFLVIGLYTIARFVGDKGKWCLAAVYVMAFLSFFIYYVAVHDQKAAEVYGDGMPEAIREVTSEKYQDYEVHVLSGINYGEYLFYSSYPADVYVSTVEYEMIGDDLEPVPVRCEGVDFTGEMVLDEGPALYICGTGDEKALAFMRGHQMEIRTYTSLAVGEWAGNEP